MFRSLSGVTGTTECARAMILSSVMSLGGLEASWSKQHLVIKDAGQDEDLGLDHVRYTKADRWVLTVCVEHEVERAIKDKPEAQQLEFLRMQIEMRVLGLGWDQFATRWSS